MNIEIENVDLNNSLLADYETEFKTKKEEVFNRTLDFSSIHKLQGNPAILSIAFHNQLSEELNSK